MKNKKGRFYCVAGVLYLLAILFVMNDAWLYQTPIVKVTKVVTIVEGKSKSTRGTEETKYKQSLYGKIIKGEDKGKEVRIANEYTTTEMADQKYHKGDRVDCSDHRCLSHKCYILVLHMKFSPLVLFYVWKVTNTRFIFAQQ